MTPFLPICHSQIQAQLDKLGTRKEEVSDKWDRHWEWLQQSEWGPRHMGLKGTGTCSGTFGKGQRKKKKKRKGPEGDTAGFGHHSWVPSNMKAWEGGQEDCLAIEPLLPVT